MRVGAWLLCVSWFYAWAEHSQTRRGQGIGLPEPGQDRRSETRVKEQAHHRSRPHRRRGSGAHAEEMLPHIVHHPSDVVVRVGHPATLSCRADGSPKPTIEWLRNGQPLETAKADGQSQPMALPDGSLFFLSVGGGRRGQSHEGVYTCMAKNSVGKATSRSASLHIAVLREEFGVQPSDVEVAEGEVAVLHCGPPSGHPEPNIMWKKDGMPVDGTDHHYTELSGKLIIAPAEKNHSGAYVCVASNTMGARESRAARLSVLSKPVLVLKPGNVSVRMGESAQFYCQARGDPLPTVVWSREEGPLPNGRYLVNPDHTLQIHYVTAQDAGRYTCTATNDVGVVAASALLLIEDAASAQQKDLHKELSVLRVALENVSIVVSGSNMSHVQWKLQSLPAQPHYLDGFEVLYRSLLPASSEWAAKKVTPPRFRTEVGPLRRGYKYEFKVRPYGSNLYGRESNTRHVRIPETVPGAPPQSVSITVSREQNNTVSLSWEPPPHEALNGIIQGYQVRCVDPEGQQYGNWTVASGQQSLEIPSLAPGGQYWLTVAAVNGAGVGTLSDPRGVVIGGQVHAGGPPDLESERRDTSQALALLQDPVLIAGVGALLWCVLMVAAICVFRQRGKGGPLVLGRSGKKGLLRLANKDLVIKHRTVAPDSPWISAGWRPAFSQKYQDLWAQAQNHPGIGSAEGSCIGNLPRCRSVLRSVSSGLPASSRHQWDAAVPVATDGCGSYGAFYVDVMGNGFGTFNSPGCRAKTPHGPPQQRGVETIQIFPQPLTGTSPVGSHGVSPWKRAIRPQPKMGVLRESWETKHGKQELQAVNSVPIVPTGDPAWSSSACKQRLSHIQDYGKFAGHPCLLHYSASVQLVDVFSPPTAASRSDATNTLSLSSDEGFSHCTKLTEDVASAAGPYGEPGVNNNSFSCSRLGTTSYSRPPGAGQCSTAQYLELGPKPERCSALPAPRPSSPVLSCARGPPTQPGSDPEANAQCARLQSSPSSCCSEWDGSLWSTWSSVTDGTLASARTSLISSVDSCCDTDASFARLLAVAAEAMSRASFSDASPPGALQPPAWDWSAAWMEAADSRHQAHRPGGRSEPFDAWGPGDRHNPGE